MKPSTRKISITECYNTLQQYSILTLFIDTRGFLEYRNSHIRNSINIHFVNLEKIDHLDPQCPQSGDFSRFKNRKIYRRFLLYGDENIIEGLISGPLGKTPEKEVLILSDYPSFKKKYPFLLVTPTQRPIPNELPSEIIDDFLYLGSRLHGTSLKILEALKITYIVNVAMEIKNNEEGMTYCEIEGIDDKPEESLSKVLEKSIKFIKEVRKKEGCKVIVHCNLGVSRSSSVVIAYIMKTMKLSYEEAREFVKFRRPIIRPNKGFEKQLKIIKFE